MDSAASAGDVSFEITMKKSSFKAMTIPAGFVREHGDKFRDIVHLGYGKTKPQWKVNVNVYIMKKHAHVSFGGGWKEFARLHDIKQGDRMKFELVEDSGFNVVRAAPNDDDVIVLSSDDN